MKKTIFLLTTILFQVFISQAQQNDFDIVLAKADSIYSLGEYMHAIRTYDLATSLSLKKKQKAIIENRKTRTYASIDSMIIVVQNSKKENVNMKQNMETAIFDNAASVNNQKTYIHGILTDDIDTLDLSFSNIRYLPPQVVDCKRLKSINLTGNPNLDIDSAFAVMDKLKLLTDIKVIIDSIQQVPIRYNHRITGLEIRQEGLSKLNPMIIRYRNLKYLNISGTADSSNNFTQFPEIIYNFKKLQFLSMNYCQLQAIPPEIKQLQNLKTLSLEHNNLTELPTELAEIQNITQLRLNDNKFGIFPTAITKLINLKILGLYNNQMADLPPDIGNLKNLTLLYIWNNQITVIPPEIGELQNLIDFRLHNNQTKAIPETIGNLQNLVYLSLSYNDLATLPEGIWKLKKLKFLWLHENELTELPAELANLEGLIELDAGNNKITALPKTIGQLQQLKTINLQNNNLTELPEEIAQIQTLNEIDLENNKITSLPIAMRDMEGLQYVYTEDNDFSEAELQKNKEMFGDEIITTKPTIAYNIENKYSKDTLDYLPDDIEKYTNLKSIDLIEERIRDWNTVMRKLSKLPILTEIKVDYDAFMQIHDKYKNLITGIKSNVNREIPSIILLQLQLTYLDLSYNELTSLPKELEALTELESINLIGTDIKNWNKTMLLLNKLPKLKEIKVNYYDFENISFKYQSSITGIKCEINDSIPKIIFHQKQLTFLDLSNNRLPT